MGGGRRALALLPLLVALGGCEDQTLYSNLSEQEANEMIALMYSSDLPGKKVATGDGSFAVQTSDDAFASAVGLLQANGLPRTRFESLGDVFKREGFVSSPLEERARLNYALSQEIAHTLSTIDGVVSVRVLLAVPEHDPLQDEVRESSASVLVKHRSDVDLSGSVAMMKALVVDGVENVPYENVTIALFPAEDRRWPTRGAPVPALSDEDIARLEAAAERAR